MSIWFGVKGLKGGGGEIPWIQFQDAMVRLFYDSSTICEYKELEAWLEMVKWMVPRLYYIYMFLCRILLYICPSRSCPPPCDNENSSVS